MFVVNWVDLQPESVGYLMCPQLEVRNTHFRQSVAEDSNFNYNAAPNLPGERLLVPQIKQSESYATHQQLQQVLSNKQVLSLKSTRALDMPRYCLVFECCRREFSSNWFLLFQFCASNGWSVANTQVLCRQLGFRAGTHYRFYTSTSSWYSREPRCVGTESSISGKTCFDLTSFATVFL